MELAGKEKNREQADEKEPGVFSTHVFNKTKLRQEWLLGQAIRFVNRKPDVGSYITSARNG
jgi:hypothetical protein